MRRRAKGRSRGEGRSRKSGREANSSALSQSSDDSTVWVVRNSADSCVCEFVRVIMCVCV